LRSEDLQAAHSKAASIREPIEQIFIILKREEDADAGRRGLKRKGKPTGANAERIPKPFV
jgi:hypothetical protein